jgi:hypothetical protein
MTRLLRVEIHPHAEMPIPRKRYAVSVGDAAASSKVWNAIFPKISSLGPSMGTIISLIIGGLFCTFSLNDAVPFIFRYGWAYFFYLLGKNN